MTDLNFPLPYPESYWVIPGRLLAGQYPGTWSEEGTRTKLDGLLQVGIQVFIDLTQPGECQPYAPVLKELSGWLGVHADHRRFAIQDFGVTTETHLVEILDAIDQALKEEKPVYVHCRGGIGRTGTVVGCYLVRHGQNAETVLDRIAELRRQTPSARLSSSPESDDQRRMVLGWCLDQ